MLIEVNLSLLSAKERQLHTRADKVRNVGFKLEEIAGTQIPNAGESDDMRAFSRQLTVFLNMISRTWQTLLTVRETLSKQWKEIIHRRRLTL